MIASAMTEGHENGTVWKPPRYIGVRFYSESGENLRSLTENRSWALDRKSNFVTSASGVVNTSL